MVFVCTVREWCISSELALFSLDGSMVSGRVTVFLDVSLTFLVVVTVFLEVVLRGESLEELAFEEGVL